MPFKIERTHLPMIIALAVAAVIVAWYVLSGRNSYDQNARKLSTEQNIQKVDALNPTSLEITCKNGQKYSIEFTKGQANYDDLIFNACGIDGTQASE